MIIPRSPMLFFIIAAHDKTMSTESDANLPTMGTKLLMEYLAVFTSRPSADFVTIPCIAVIPVNTVTIRPVV